MWLMYDSLFIIHKLFFFFSSYYFDHILFWFKYLCKVSFNSEIKNPWEEKKVPSQHLKIEVFKSIFFYLIWHSKHIKEELAKETLKSRSSLKSLGKIHTAININFTQIIHHTNKRFSFFNFFLLFLNFPN